MTNFTASLLKLGRIKVFVGIAMWISRPQAIFLTTRVNIVAARVDR